MNKSDVTNLLKTAQKTLSQHSPKILTGVGIGCMIGGAIMAVKATPKAIELIEEEKESRKQTPNDEVELTKAEMVKVAWKPYVPATLTILLGTSCIIGATSVSARRQAVLYSALKLSETTLAELKDKTAEVVGPEKVKEIKQKIAEDKVEKIKEESLSTQNVIVTNDGESWFIDPFTNTPFRSSINKLDAAANKLNKEMRDDMYISLSQFYDEIGLEHTATSDYIGWRIDKSYIDIEYSDAVIRDGKAYIVMDFLVRPEYGYDKIY